MIPILQRVSLRDLDAFGHVNGSVYLTYFENGRVALMEEAFGVQCVDDIGNVMVAASIEYEQPITYPCVVIIETSVARVGKKSFALDYVVRSEQVVHARGRSVQVSIDMDGGQSVPLDEARREALMHHLAEPDADLEANDT